MPIIYLWGLILVGILILIFTVRSVLKAVKDIHDRTYLLCAVIIAASILVGFIILSGSLT